MTKQQPSCMDRQQIKAQILCSLAQSQLQSLQKVLQLRGWYTRLEPGGIGPPRLFGWHPVFGELEEAICLVYRHIGPDNPMWFQWASGELICRAKHIQHVVRLIESSAKQQTLSARLARGCRGAAAGLQEGTAFWEQALPAV
jgi:hypothetical protein